MKLLPASLTLRLSLAFAGLAVAVFSALGVYLGRAADEHMLELDRHELLGKLELARHAAAGAASAEALRAGLVESLVGHHGLWVAIDGGTSAVAGNTKGMAAEASRCSCVMRSRTARRCERTQGSWRSPASKKVTCSPEL